MFDKNYYKNKFIIEEEGLYTLCEANITSNNIEFFMYKIDENKKFAIYLRNYEQMKYIKNKIISLKDFLLSVGYTDNDFRNPFNKTEKIVRIINKINIHNKENREKTKQKISH